MFRYPRLILILAVLAVAASGPLTRLVPLQALTLVAWRLSLTLPIFWLQARFLGGVREGRPSPATLALWGAAALLLAVHFFAFAAAIQSAGVSMTTMLLALQPLVTTLLSPLIAREPAPPGAKPGVALALPGMVLVALSASRGAQATPLAGLLLALLCAVSGSLYFLLVRRLRTAVPFGWLLAGNYSAAAAGLMIAAALGPGLALPRPAWLGLALLVFIPTAMGHNLINLSLRHLPAPTVNLAILLEPICATTFAILVFHERPGILFYPGAFLILAGCAIALRPPLVKT